MCSHTAAIQLQRAQSIHPPRLPQRRSTASAKITTTIAAIEAFERIAGRNVHRRNKAVGSGAGVGAGVRTAPRLTAIWTSLIPVLLLFFVFLGSELEDGCSDGASLESPPHHGKEQQQVLALQDAQAELRTRRPSVELAMSAAVTLTRREVTLVEANQRDAQRAEHAVDGSRNESLNVAFSDNR